MNFTIRLAKVTDTNPLTILFNTDKNIYGDNGTGFGERDIAEYISDDKKKLFVCENDGKIVAVLNEIKECSGDRQVIGKALQYHPRP